MNFYERLTKYRYNYKNSYSSFKFIDFMNTDMEGTYDSYPDKSNENSIRQIVRSVFSYRRYEPCNPYVFHKVVPSARNVHPNEAFLIEDGFISRFNSKANQFEMLGYSRHYEGRLWIIIASELWRIMKFYGDFGLALSLLDVGHIQAHVKLKLLDSGYERARLLYGVDTKKLIQSLGFSKNSACIGAVIDLSEYVSEIEFLSEKDRVKTGIQQRKFNYDDEVGSYPQVIEFLHYRDEPKTKPIAYHEGANKLCKDLAYEIYRNSGHSTPGLFSTTERLPTATAKRYAEGIAEYIKYFLGDKSGFWAGVLYRALDGEDYLIIVSEAGTERINKCCKIHREELLHDTFEHINMNSIPLDIFLIYSIDPYSTQEENIRNAHIGAGEISQYISLMAAKDGFFARPMKNFNDNYISKLIGIDSNRESIVYSTIIGRENHYNYVLKL
jgi:hypothetical protein